MENPDQSEWVTTSLCENPRRSSPKKIVPDIRYLIVILDDIVFLNSLPTLCSLGCCPMFLGMIPVL